MGIIQKLFVRSLGNVIIHLDNFKITILHISSSNFVIIHQPAYTNKNKLIIMIFTEKILNFNIDCFHLNHSFNALVNNLQDPVSAVPKLNGSKSKR